MKIQDLIRVPAWETPLDSGQTHTKKIAFHKTEQSHMKSYIVIVSPPNIRLNKVTFA